MFDRHVACADVQIKDAADGRVEVTPRRKAVALVGFGSNTRALAPWTDPGVEIWGMNQGHTFMPRRADRWFEMHRPEHTPDLRDPDYMGFLSKLEIPVYCLDVRNDIPWSVRFPIERAMAQAGGLDYFTSTIPYMVSLAMDEGFEAIGFYGIDLTTEEEYSFQRPCAEFWIGMAFKAGISIYIPPESALCKQRWRYGYEVAPKFGGIDPGIMDADAERAEATMKEALRVYHTNHGFLQGVRHFQSLQAAANRGTTIARPFDGHDLKVTSR